MFEYFVTGMLFSLTGVLALTAIAYFKGWLQTASDQLLGSEVRDSRKLILNVLEEGRAYRAGLYKLVNDQDFARLTSALSRLSVNEAEQRKTELMLMAADIEEVAKELKGVLLAAARQVGSTTRFSNNSEPQTQRYNPNVGANTAQAQAQAAPKRPVRKFKDNEFYAYVDDNNPSPVQMSGKKLNDLLEQGLVDSVDFFVYPMSIFQK